MTSNGVARIATPNLPAPSRVGQATAVEQSRAVAEVQAAIVVAQQCPRSIQAAMTAMEESCQQKFLAEKAFYRFRRGGQNVSGETVHLARELARCFGNIQYGLHELRRDDEAGQSEMQAWAWDVQMNTRSSTTFIVPHVRDGGQDGGRLTATRDIYENNANNGARRLREMIVAILPPWFVETAKELCMRTLEGDGTKPLAQRIAGSIKAFGVLGVTQGQLEQKLSRPIDSWTPHDLAQLEVTYRSLQRGEVSRDEEFPPELSAERVTSADIVRPPTVVPPAATSTTPEAPVPTEPVAVPDVAEYAGMADKDSRLMFKLFRDAGMTDKDVQLTYIGQTIGRDIESRKELTAEDGGKIIDALNRYIAQQEPPVIEGGS